MLASRDRGRTRPERHLPASRSRDRTCRVAPHIRQSMNKTLVVDIGGTRVKLMLEGAEQRGVDSRARMEPNEFVAPLTANNGGGAVYKKPILFFLSPAAAPNLSTARNTSGATLGAVFF